MELDLKGLRCPLPTLKARRQLMRMKAGEQLTVIADDPMAAIDLPHYCREANHRLIAFEREDELLRFIIEAGGGEDADQPNL